ncbi:alpha-hydroxy acid oxidase [Variovorax sp. RT4R15]|uniref:alpha-hydroxy acid oxidase n=1 Tax=Variovorax sp. RT4R15 TaxID=3443737 RepID=UPI003F481673
MLLNTHDYHRLARRRLPRFVYEYLAGGAEDEHCLRRNSEDLARLQLLPTCLRDTSSVDTTIELFGQRWQAPFALAPIGLCGLVRPGGDRMMARAAAGAGVPHILSTASNARLEALHDGPAPALQWMQLYVMSERSIAAQIVRRAKAAGFGALVLTVDVPVSGARERDARNHFKLPFRPTPGLVLDILRHPGWLWRLACGGAPSFVNMSADGAPGSTEAQAALLAREMDRRLDWDSLHWLRRLWDGPLLLKGVLHPADARRALAQGVDGLIVSNHGGRQFDAAPSSITALPAVLDAVGARMPVLVDGGFRRGSDVVKALALGAKAVLLGRPPVYGLASGGEQGVAAVLALLRQEIERSMVLLGAASIGDVGHHHMMAAIPSHT